VNPESRGMKEHRNLGREKLLFAFNIGGRDISRVGVLGACHRGVRWHIRWRARGPD